MKRIWSITAWLLLYLATASSYLSTNGRHFRLDHNARAYQLGNHSDEVVFLGASLVGDSIIPGVVERELPDPSPSAYALSFPNCRAWTYYFVWRDLIRRKGKPKLLILGLSPTHVNADLVDHESAKFSKITDILTLIRKGGKNGGKRLELLRERLKTVLQGWPRLILNIDPPETTAKMEMKGSHYWDHEGRPDRREQQLQAFSQLPDEDTYQRVLAQSRKEFSGNFQFGDCRYWLEKLLDEARREDVEVCLLLFRYSHRMSEDLGEYHLARTERFLEDISAEYEVPLWKSWEIWPGVDDWRAHYDGARHLKPQAAHTFSRALASGPLRKVLTGE